MTPSGQSLCLAMIVRNEAPVIRRCLASVRSLIDHWIVVDTGSTDGTQDLVRAALGDLPGTLIERPWVDFGHNRSEALALARPHGTYTLVIDADDELLVPPGYTLPTLDADSYDVAIADGPITYRRTQVVRNALTWVYRGVLHEFPNCPEATRAGALGLTLRRNHDGARRRDPETYRRDAALLQAALASETDPFLTARYLFYLGQSYRDCGAAEEAVDAYLRRADLGFWEDEVYVALCTAAGLMAGLGRPMDTVLETYRRAIAIRPDRAEARHGASRACRLAGHYAEGFRFAQAGLGLVAPEGGLFVEPWIYAYGLRDEYAVNAYWAGRYRDCLSACLDLLACTEVPADDRPRHVANARFALEKLPVPYDPGRGLLPSARGGIAATTPMPVPARAARWSPEQPQGGTEIMAAGLSRHLGPDLVAIDLRLNGYDAAGLDGRPLVIWIHHAPDQAAVAWLRDSEKVRRVARFVFVSEWQRAGFLAAFELPPERCLVLRNATEVPQVDRPARRNLPLKVAYTSVPYRGLAILLEAWARLAPRWAELHVWSSHKLYGRDADDAPYEALYARAATLPGVHYHGLLPNADLRAALAGIDILAYPSTFAETSCLAVIEAMAAGCRVLCPTLGALPETTAGFARLYPFVADPDAHAAAFTEILRQELSDPWMGQAAQASAQQAFCRQTYDWRVRIPEWRSLLDDLRADARAPTPSGASWPVFREVDSKRGRFFVVDGDYIGRTLSLTGDWEPHLYAFAALVLDPRSHILDLGANFGVHTVGLARLVPEGSVHAFEPLDLCFSQLHRNVLANGLGNVRTYRMAVTDRSGDRVEMEPPDATLTADGTVNLGLTRIGRGGDGVSTIRLDDLRLPPITFIKMDIQGSEALAVEGMRELLARDRPVVFLEIEEDHLRRSGSSSKILIERFLALDYSLLRIRTEWPTDHLAIPNERADLIARCRDQPHHDYDWISGSGVDLEFENSYFYTRITTT